MTRCSKKRQETTSVVVDIAVDLAKSLESSRRSETEQEKIRARKQNNGNVGDLERVCDRVTCARGDWLAENAACGEARAFLL